MMSKVPHLKLNPIIVKELRARMRDSRAFLVLTSMLLLLGGGSYLLYRITLATANYYSGTPLSPQIGQSLFIALAFLEMMVIAAIAPAITAGAVSGEKEKQTYEMLLATPLRPGSILWGKLLSALSYVFLLIFAAIPMASLIFIFGGVTLRDMLKALIILFSVAIMLGMLGMFMSVLLGRTSRATVVSYLVVVALIIGPMVAYMAFGILRQAEPPRWILVPNPVSALFSALSPGNAYSNPGLGAIWYLGSWMGGNWNMITGSTVSMTGIPRPLYHYSLPFYAMLTLVLYLLSTRLIRPTQRWKISWKEVLGGAALILLLTGLVTVAFWGTSDRYENTSVFAAPTPAPFIQEAVAERVVVPQEQVVAKPYPEPDDEAYPPPSEGSEGAAADALVLSVQDRVEIYAAVIRQLYTVDHTFGDSAPEIPVLYIVWTTDDKAGDPNQEPQKSIAISEEERVQILNLLTGSGSESSDANQPREIKWIETRDEAPLDAQTGEVAGGGAIITLGNIHQQDDGSVQVPASIYFASLIAGGRTYILMQTGGAWQIIGDTGVEWIS
ncbi:MAG: hypothetical protein EHM70_13880 [Chloroflexota bacterium]|nr:MAG: hypothetical protein EHM70_13880 [Chloroflexota bacterium]